jgi:hypothetical protein
VVPARGEWLTTVEAVPVWDGIPMTPHHPPGQPAEHAVTGEGWDVTGLDGAGVDLVRQPGHPAARGHC